MDENLSEDNNSKVSSFYDNFEDRFINSDDDHLLKNLSPKNGWLIFFLTGIFFVAGIFVLNHFLENTDLSFMLSILIFEVVFYGLIILLLIIFPKIQKISLRNALGLHQSMISYGKTILQAFFLGVGIFILNLIFISAGINIQIIPVMNQVNYFTSINFGSTEAIFAIIFIILLPPIVEELLFRGYIFNSFSRKLSEDKTIFLTAFLFSILHCDSLLHIINTFALGLFLGYKVEKSGSVYTSIVGHFVYNLTVLIIVPFIAGLIFAFIR